MEDIEIGDSVELIQDDRFHYKVLDIIEDDFILEDYVSGNRYRYKKELFKLKERKNKMKIEVGNNYSHACEGGVKVLEVTDKGVAVRRLDNGMLFWANAEHLSERRSLLPLQQAILYSKEQHINVIAVGRASGTTTGIIEKILDNKKSCVLVVCNRIEQVRIWKEAYKLLGKDKNHINPCCKDLVVEGKGFHVNVITKDSLYYSFVTDNIYFDVGWENLTRTEILSICSRFKTCWFATTPYDLTDGYKVTIEKGYYEVEDCPNPLLDYVIEKSGKIPVDTAQHVKQFLEGQVNLITDYNYTNNPYLGCDFGKCIESLNPIDNRKLKGKWVTYS